ncbi:MAG: hypothetical protein EBR86_11215 [Planctomycetia bacterium]|nr:hypothetical protein [Planctomycetia bacterium]
MSNVVHYYQPCPVCGRSLQIRVNLLGKRVFCQHCGGGFRAADPATNRVTCAAAQGTDHDGAAFGVGPAPADRCAGEDLLRRVEVVLQRAEQVGGHVAAGSADSR